MKIQLIKEKNSNNEWFAYLKVDDRTINCYMLSEKDKEIDNTLLEKAYSEFDKYIEIAKNPTQPEILKEIEI